MGDVCWLSSSVFVILHCLSYVKGFCYSADIIACQIKIIKENIFNCFLDKFYVLNIIWIEYTKYDILKEKLLWQQQTSMQRQH